MKFKILFSFLLALSISSCKTGTLKPAEIEGKRIAIDQSITPDSSIENFIKPYSQHINKTLDSVLAYNPTNLNKSDGELNTALGNLMADIIMVQVNPVFKSRTGKEIDLVVLNYGGIRAAVGKGPVNARTAYSLMPFENEVVIVELSGEKINEMLSYLESNRTAHPLSGIQIRVDKNYKIIEATINREKIDPEKTYFVATSDYLQQGGDNMIFFKDPVNFYNTDYKIRNTIIDYFQKVDTLKTKRDNRYIKIQ
ncbi:MAG: 5'-nucleotidase C-terminal domain-containing protein [Bacteroidota bacterium]